VRLKFLNLFWITFFLAGCSCDSICEANKDTTEFLNQKHTEGEIIEYLKTYIGEAPGTEKYGVFVNWGLDNQDRFVATMNHPSITSKELGRVLRTISKLNYSERYCQIYRDRHETENEKHIRKSLQGCEIGL